MLPAEVVKRSSSPKMRTKLLKADSCSVQPVCNHRPEVAEMLPPFADPRRQILCDAIGPAFETSHRTVSSIRLFAIASGPLRRISGKFHLMCSGILAQFPRWHRTSAELFPSAAFARQDFQGQLLQNSTRAARKYLADLTLTAPAKAPACAAPDRKKIVENRPSLRRVNFCPTAGTQAMNDLRRG